MKLEQIARKRRPRPQYELDHAPVKRELEDKSDTTEERRVVHYADGSGYVEGGGPCGPLYFDRNGNT